MFDRVQVQMRFCSPDKLNSSFNFVVFQLHLRRLCNVNKQFVYNVRASYKYFCTLYCTQSLFFLLYFPIQAKPDAICSFHFRTVESDIAFYGLHITLHDLGKMINWLSWRFCAFRATRIIQSDCVRMVYFICFHCIVFLKQLL